MTNKQKQHPLTKDINKQINIYHFRLLEGGTAVPTKPIAIMDAEQIGARFHCEILAPLDTSIIAMTHVISFFETLYPQHAFEFSSTLSDAIAPGHIVVCFVTT